MLAATALVQAAPASAQSVAADGDPVLYWNQVMLSTLTGSPVVNGRAISMFEIAMHDAASASLGGKSNTWLPTIQGAPGDMRAAISVAAHQTLSTLYPGSTATFDAALSASLAAVPDGLSKTNGIALGSAVASGVLAARANDGFSLPPTYVSVGGPGRWVPTPPAFVAPSFPQFASTTPFLISSPGAFRPAAPPAIDSPEYAAYLNEVMEIGALNSLTRSPDQSAAATFWAAPPASGTGPWINAAIQGSLGSGLSTLQNAQLMAKLSVAVVDASIATWDAKYIYDFWRPVTAIQNADLDGNVLTVSDPFWTPFAGSPPHPSYVSAHAAVAGAASSVLDAYLPGNSGFCLTIAASNRCWADYDAAAQDAADSRLWAGIHYRFDNEAGLALGRQVGNFVIGSNTFTGSVPEPATWLMLLAGFGAIGGLLRRGRRVHGQIAFA